MNPAGAVSTRELAAARVQAAGTLEAAIVALGVAYAAYQRTTQQLSDRAVFDLARGLELPIVLHLVKAGLSELLERKLTGTPASLHALALEQSERVLAAEGHGLHR